MQAMSSALIMRHFYLITTIIIVLQFGVICSLFLFDGFSSFSNDSANYILMARKWSP